MPAGNKRQKSFLKVSAQHFLPGIAVTEPEKEERALLSRQLKQTNSQRVTLNVGGEVHEVLLRTMNFVPHSRLARLSAAETESEVGNLCDEYDLETLHFFFDRYPRIFNSVLHFCRSGKLHVPDNICPILVSEELNYWGLQEFDIVPCCLREFYDRKDAIREENDKEEAAVAEAAVSHDYQFGGGKLSQLRSRVWSFWEQPQSTKLARAAAILSIVFVAISCLGLILNTMDAVSGCPVYDHTSNYTSGANKPVADKGCQNPYLSVVETVCIAWFTMEYLSRLLAAPKIAEFLKSPLNAIDLLAITPFYMQLFVKQGNDEYFSNTSKMAQVVRVLRILRVFRILKLARHSSGLQSLGQTFRSSKRELGMLVMFLSIGIMLFSSLVYFAEKEVPGTKYTSIPAAFWWASITMTTVGYGDICPVTPVGRVLGAMCSISGVLVLALPVPVIVNNFTRFCRERVMAEKALKRRAEIESAKKNAVLPIFDTSGMRNIMQGVKESARRLSSISTAGALPLQRQRSQRGLLDCGLKVAVGVDDIDNARSLVTLFPSKDQSSDVGREIQPEVSENRATEEEPHLVNFLPQKEDGEMENEEFTDIIMSKIVTDSTALDDIDLSIDAVKIDPSPPISSTLGAWDATEHTSLLRHVSTAFEDSTCSGMSETECPAFQNTSCSACI